MKISLVFVVIILVFTFLITKFITIKNFVCESQYGPCSEIISREIDEAKGGNIFQVQKKLSTILKHEVLVSDFSLRYNLPDKIKISLVEKKSIAAIKQKNNSDTPIVLVSETGNPLKYVTTTNLPVLLVDSIPTALDTSLSQDTVFSIKLLKEIFLTYGVKEAMLEKSMLVSTIQGYQVTFPLQGDLDVILGSLRIILYRLNTHETSLRIRSIDLRFKNPVLK